jgi:hypothetical protein
MSYQQSRVRYCVPPAGVTEPSVRNSVTYEVERLPNSRGVPPVCANYTAQTMFGAVLHRHLACVPAETSHGDRRETRPTVISTHELSRRATVNVERASSLLRSPLRRLPLTADTDGASFGALPSCSERTSWKLILRGGSAPCQSLVGRPALRPPFAGASFHFSLLECFLLFSCPFEDAADGVSSNSAFVVFPFHPQQAFAGSQIISYNPMRRW